MTALKEYFDNPTLGKKDSFVKDSLDSFEKMNLLILLEEICDIELSIIELFECNTIGEIVDLCMNGDQNDE